MRDEPLLVQILSFSCSSEEIFYKTKGQHPPAKDGIPAKDSTPSPRMAPTAKDSYPTLRMAPPQGQNPSSPPLDRHAPLKILPSRNFVGLSTSLESWHSPLGNHGSTTEMCLLLHVFAVADPGFPNLLF